MAEYIEREALYEKLHEAGGCDAPEGSWADGWDKGINEAIRLLENQPTADVVEVVRCKDCKWWKNGELCRNVNGLNSIVWNGEWFCASGQRKEGAEE